MYKPNVLLDLMRLETAGVDKIPFCPINSLETCKNMN